jgi:hypothetical protein
VACAGEDSGEALRRWRSFLATRGAALEHELASGGTATAASGGRENRGGRKGEGGILGSYLQLQELQGLHCKTKLPTILKLK